MKRILFFILVCKYFVSYAQVEGGLISYQLHPNDTITFMQDQVDNDGKKSSSTIQLVVHETADSRALVEFNSIFDDENASGEDQYMELLKSKILSPLIELDKGVSQRVVNIEEMKSSFSDLLDELTNAPTLSQKEKDSLQLAMRIIKPLFEKLHTEEAIMQEFSDLVISNLPEKLGSAITKKDGKKIKSTLKATDNPNEYRFHQVIQTEYSGADILSGKGQHADPMVAALSSMGGIFVAMIESVKIEINRDGVVLANGLPKEVKVATKMTMSALGEQVKRTSTKNISMITGQ